MGLFRTNVVLAQHVADGSLSGTMRLISSTFRSTWETLHTNGSCLPVWKLVLLAEQKYAGASEGLGVLMALEAGPHFVGLVVFFPGRWPSDAEKEKPSSDKADAEADKAEEVDPKKAKVLGLSPRHCRGGFGDARSPKQSRSLPQRRCDSRTGGSNPPCLVRRFSLRCKMKSP